MTAVESHSTTHVSRTHIAQLGDEIMSTLTFVTPDTHFSPTGAKYKPALVAHFTFEIHIIIDAPLS